MGQEKKIVKRERGSKLLKFDLAITMTVWINCLISVSSDTCADNGQSVRDVHQHEYNGRQIFAARTILCQSTELIWKTNKCMCLIYAVLVKCAGNIFGHVKSSYATCST